MAIFIVHLAESFRHIFTAIYWFHKINYSRHNKIMAFEIRYYNADSEQRKSQIRHWAPMLICVKTIFLINSKCFWLLWTSKRWFHQASFNWTLNHWFKTYTCMSKFMIKFISYPFSRAWGLSFHLGAMMAVDSVNPGNCTNCMEFVFHLIFYDFLCFQCLNLIQKEFLVWVFGKN